MRFSRREYWSGLLLPSPEAKGRVGQNPGCGSHEGSRHSKQEAPSDTKEAARQSVGQKRTELTANSLPHAFHQEGVAKMKLWAFPAGLWVEREAEDSKTSLSQAKQRVGRVTVQVPRATGMQIREWEKRKRLTEVVIAASLTHT